MGEGCRKFLTRERGILGQQEDPQPKIKKRIKKKTARLKSSADLGCLVLEEVLG